MDSCDGARMFGVATEADRASLAPILAHCFGFNPAEAPDWFERAGHANLRSYRAGEALLGGLIVVPMGQYFGGRSVPMTGIAGVGISPEARGGGHATKMMAACVREIREAGVALSTLYPATVPLYRGVGYARAGARYEIELAPGAAATRARGMRLERVDGEDDPDVHAAYARYAAHRPGFLDRGPYIWGRIFRPRKGHHRAFKAMGENGCEGYVVVGHKMGDSESEVNAADFVALTRPAAERLLDLLAGYGSIATTVRWHGGAPDLLTSALRDRRHDVRLTDYWMVRVCDVERALGARGYAASGALDLEVEDDVLPENAGRYRLRVSDGHARIERGGDGTFKIDVRGLAALYTGFHDARTLRDLGELDARDEALAIADALFSQRAPAMGDFF